MNSHQTFREDNPTTWQTCELLSNHTKKLWNEPYLSDITIRLYNGKELHLHRAVLSRAAYFETQFKQQATLGQHSNVMDFQEDDPILLEFALLFLYGYDYMECYNVIQKYADVADIFNILCIANKYHFRELKIETARQFCEIFDGGLFGFDMDDSDAVWAELRKIFASNQEVWLHDRIIADMQKRGRLLMQDRERLDDILYNCPALDVALAVRGGLPVSAYADSDPMTIEGASVEEQSEKRRKRVRSD